LHQALIFNLIKKVAHHINDPAQKLFVERSRDGTPVGSAHKVFVERSRDEKPMNIRTPRLPSGATLRLAQKLYVERSRDENTGWYSSTPRLRSGCTRLLLHSPRVEGCPKGGVSSSTPLKNCSSSEAETKTPVGIPYPSATLGVQTSATSSFPSC